MTVFGGPQMPQMPQMTQSSMGDLWRVTASPLIWAMHFMLSYATAAIWCAKVAGPAGSLWQIRVAIAVYSVVALAAVGFIGWSGYRRHKYSGARVPQNADTPEERHRFLGFSTFLLSLLSGVAIVYATFVLIFFQSCT